MIKTLTFLGHSTAEFEGVTVASADYGNVEARRADEELPLRNGALNGSRQDGKICYKSRTLTYVLNVLATPATIESRLSALRTWLSSGCGDLTDGYNTGWKFTNADFLSAKVDYLDMFRRTAQMTVQFTADPYQQSTTGSRQRIVAWTAQGNTARIVIDNEHLYVPTWLEVPSTPSNTVLTFPINATAEQQSNRSFYIFGIPSGVTVEDAYIVRQSQTITGEVTMRSPERGTLGSVEEDDMVVITYSGNITAAVAVGGVGAASATYTIANPHYRLDTLTEGTPTVRINGGDPPVDITRTFTLPATALLQIYNSGYGYYELWHDTTEVRL